MLRIKAERGGVRVPRRRSLVQAGFLGALGLTLPQHAALAESARGRAVILLWLWGGPPHLDLFDPKPDAPPEYRGPYRPLETNVSGIQLTELLPRLARQAHRFSLLRSLHHQQNDHGIAGTIQMTGRSPVNGRVHPHTGAVVSRLRGNPELISRFFVLGERLQQGHRLIQGEGGGQLGAVYDPLRVTYDPVAGVQLGEVNPPQGVDRDRAERRRLLRAGLVGQSPAPMQGREVEALQKLYEKAFSLISSTEGRKVFDLARESARLRDTYGRHRFGQSCLLARRLVETGVRFVQVNWSTHVEAEEDAGDGGWDNHYRNFEMLADRQAWPFDQACAALLGDLSDRGMLEDTLVAVVGEFGRTPRINPNAGRDHWPSCYSALLAGGGIRPGLVVGASDNRGEYPASRPLTPEDLCATLLECAGITRTDVLGLGLPVEGEPIHELL